MQGCTYIHTFTCIHLHAFCVCLGPCTPSTGSCIVFRFCVLALGTMVCTFACGYGILRIISTKWTHCPLGPIHPYMWPLLVSLSWIVFSSVLLIHYIENGLFLTVQPIYCFISVFSMPSTWITWRYRCWESMLSMHPY